MDSSMTFWNHTACWNLIGNVRRLIKRSSVVFQIPTSVAAFDVPQSSNQFLLED
jgi:hypothetical protein